MVAHLFNNVKRVHINTRSLLLQAPGFQAFINSPLLYQNPLVSLNLYPASLY